MTTIHNLSVLLYKSMTSITYTWFAIFKQIKKHSNIISTVMLNYYLRKKIYIGYLQYKENR